MTLKLELTFAQILDLVQQLPNDEQKLLVTHLTKAEAFQGLKEIAVAIQKNAKEKGYALPSEEEILNEVNEVRQAFYEKKKKV